MHSAVWAIGGIPWRQPGIEKALLTALFGFAGLMFVTLSSAQSPDGPDPEDTPEPVRRVQRLGAVVGGSEWQPELSVPPSDVPAELQRLLEAARIAMDDGRVDQPEDNSAWFFYRQIADQYPGHEEARTGLLAVQQDILARAIGYAVEMDFDAAGRLLESAASVIDERSQVEQARRAILNIKTSRAEILQSQAVRFMDAGDFGSAERVLIDLIALGDQADAVGQLRKRLEAARKYGGFRTGQLIRDSFLSADISTPELVVIPIGSYLMGSSSKEKGRADAEGPRQRVTFKRGFAIGRREVSVAEFSAFVSATGYRTQAERTGGSTIYDARFRTIDRKRGRALANGL